MATYADLHGLAFAPWAGTWDRRCVMELEPRRQEIQA